jgi:uncharacterized Ntn-hydrolase superfamily protein
LPSICQRFRRRETDSGLPATYLGDGSMTFSIVARCQATGMLGVAVSSSSPAVGARCSFARAGVGAVASQNVTDPRLGPKALDLLSLGANASQSMEVLKGSSPHIEYRQILVVDVSGHTATHSGSKCLGVWADAMGPDVACGGNLLKDPQIPRIMVDAFQASNGHLGDRLLSTTQAAVHAGGEAGPVRSASLRLVDKVSWPIVDLRVDWAEGCPVEALGSLWSVYKEQIDAYVARALNPAEAPSYGVSGDP